MVAPKGTWVLSADHNEGVLDYEFSLDGLLERYSHLDWKFDRRPHGIEFTAVGNVRRYTISKAKG